MNSRYYCSFADGYREAHGARPITIAGLEEFSFFIHYRWGPNPDLPPTRANGWTISEATSGLACASGATRAAALAAFNREINARDLITDAARTRFRERIAAHIARHGPSDWAGALASAGGSTP